MAAFTNKNIQSGTVKANAFAGVLLGQATREQWERVLYETVGLEHLDWVGRPSTYIKNVRG